MGGGNSTQEQKKSEEIEKNSYFNYYTIGGNNTAFTDLTSLKSGYESWVTSIENKADLCSIYDFDQSLIPIWELVDNKEKANAIKKEFEDRAILQAINLGNWKNIIEKEITYNKPGNFTFSFTENLPVRIEAYLLGAGGGGQGKSRRKHSWPTNNGKDDYCTGGGGGAAAYLLFTSETTVSIDTVVGKGGYGGAANNDLYSGKPGGNGGNTVIKWNDIIITAGGGQGGGGGDTYEGWHDLRGGAGGSTKINNPTSNLIKEYKFASGSYGTVGTASSGNKNVFGGNAGKINNFGGTGGGNNFVSINATASGGGAAGAAWDKPAPLGGIGGDGLVLIKYYYYIDE